MASQRSIFAKIGLLADVAHSATTQSIEELIDQTEAAAFTSFTVWKYDEDADERRASQSRAAIGRTAKLAHSLGVIDDRGNLVRRASSAIRRGAFEDFVAQTTWRLMEGFGVSEEMFRDTAASLTSELPDRGPTARALFESMEPACSYRDFVATLSLMSSVGAVSTFQRRLYFGPSR